MRVLLDHLNDAQQRAVCAPLGNLLILAGAGSGKTRVLVHRIAWLMQQENASPFSILAVTFTNKAANEMRTRVESLLGSSVNAMWLGTFHGLAHRLLRTHWKDAGLSENFQILDSSDQQRLVRRVMRDLNIDEERFPYKQAQWFINKKKDEGFRAQHLSAHHQPQEEMFIRIYAAYEEACAQSGLVDFAELLLRSYELWRDHDELRQHYRNRFRHILVDEFQDINGVQYAWLRLLAGENNFFTVVGDDDQLIYSWRGACADNLHKFKKDFPHVCTITLEQNYRSTSTILSAANALIGFNRDRFGKELWTDGAIGDPIRIYAAYNEIDEARFIASECLSWIDQGNTFNDVAVLYRSNAQSRVLEEALLQQGIAYRIFGGLRFFERAEIKDALAYLRLVNNRFDDTSYERIVNLPPRGIGNKSLETVRQHAREKSISLWQATHDVITHALLPARALTALESFLAMIDDLDNQTKNLALLESTEAIVNASGLIGHFQKEKGETGRARIENLRELISAAGEFNFDSVSPEEKETLTPITAFLSHATLEAGEHQADAMSNCVKLMTIHAAKGLEFPFVILCGMEEGLFPHQMSKSDPKGIEEERRLCYVGMTRAMRQLLLSYAESRRVYGQTHMASPSRFIREIPQQYLQEIRMQSKISRPASLAESSSFLNQEETSFRLGQYVRHTSFGDGVILDIEPNGEKTRVQIRFKTGTKWLIASLAKLESI
ncbi:MAG: DNA helicase II [Gammaproteobacteria bacterium]|nr:DNA helicase II [Gammaproteobacteria bacterium]